MWISRLVLLFAEYGTLFLSLLGAAVAYLVNLRRVSPSRLPFKQVWLDKWVTFKTRQENKSKVTGIASSLITVAAALAFTPLFGELSSKIKTLWGTTLATYPYEAIRIAALPLLFFLAWFLFFLRKRVIRLYAFLEIAIGLFMAWDALSFVHAPNGVPAVPVSSYWAGQIASPAMLKVMAAVYVIIRGLVNWNEKSTDTFLDPGTGN